MDDINSQSNGLSDIDIRVIDFFSNSRIYISYRIVCQCEPSTLNGIFSVSLIDFDEWSGIRKAVSIRILRTNIIYDIPNV